MSNCQATHAPARPFPASVVKRDLIGAELVRFCQNEEAVIDVSGMLSSSAALQTKNGKKHELHSVVHNKLEAIFHPPSLI